jgi:lipopolysaccharide export system protein LptA
MVTTGKKRFTLAWLLLPAIFLIPYFSFAQKTTQVEILNANTFEGDERLGKNVSRLLGNVQFRHEGVIMYCDSAYLYQESNSLDAFGSIRIVKGDSINVTGNLLKYNGNTRDAMLSGDVVMTDRKMVLTTSRLNYNMISESAEYFEGGKIVDGENVLTSRRGKYFSHERMVYFRDSVRLDNPSFYLTSDTLKYQTRSKIAIFPGPTFIHSTGADSSFIYCEKGWYNTDTKKSSFTGNPYIQSKESRLAGDSIVYDQVKMIGRAYRNVTITDTIQDAIISGDYAINDDKNKTAFVTGNAMLTRIFETDSLFLHADTLYALEDTSGAKMWRAYNGVRIYKTDLQGTCDSLVYSTQDSTIYFYVNPVLWSEQNQLTADSMNIQLANSKISELRLFNSAFICSQEDSARFNQIRGKNMRGYFQDNRLNSIKVEGNGQSIYYTRNSKKQLTGVNRADCSDMLIFIDSSKVSSITLINKPDATLYPISELAVNELRLKGFSWLSALRPKSKEDIFKNP